MNCRLATNRCPEGDNHHTGSAILTVRGTGVKTGRVNETLDRLCISLRIRELFEGGWPFLAGSTQMALEPTCLALFALHRGSPASAAVLLRTQRSDGSWGSFCTDDQASGLTGLALLTLSTFGVSDSARTRAVTWLLDSKGREASGFAKWKFRVTDTRVRFDPGRFGWPWQPDTCSWVIPTAFSLLALKQIFPGWRKGRVGYRIERGVEMLFDRACPNGGWNAGNGVVYGTAMEPHIDTTAVALLALRSEPRNNLITRSLAWLEAQSLSCASPWSLAWAILGLDSYGRSVKLLQQRLPILVESEERTDTATLAVTALALACTNSINPFMVEA